MINRHGDIEDVQMRANVEMLTECTVQLVSEAIYAGCCTLQGCLLAGFVFLCWPIRARHTGFDTLFQSRCLIAACLLQFKVWPLWGIPADTRAAQRLVHHAILSVKLESIG